jgi:hypothetical protein
LFDISDIENGLNQLKFGKACGFDGISKENLTYAHPAVLLHLKSLFNLIYDHGFVPDNFGKGIIVPVVKDTRGNTSECDNYRAITISPLISKLFEYSILNKFDSLLLSSELQFGFKRNSSCSHAIFLLRQVTEYFLNHGSNVFMGALDASKAFDRVNHVKLFNILLDRGLSGRLITVIYDWYGKTFASVKWNGTCSNPISIKSGIRQGGIISPFLFNIYFDVVFDALRSSDFGCHLPRSMYVGYIAYADDIILLSASVSDLQHMIDICFFRRF